MIVGTSVRSEVDPQELGVLKAGAVNGAVSPDGRRIAYWETTSGGGARSLWILDASAPSRSRLVLTLSDSETASVSTGGGVVWSSDGLGLLVGVNSREYLPVPPVHGPARYATLRTVDLASGAVREVARVEPGLPLRPVAFDRRSGVATAVEIGGGGYVASYVVARDGAALTRTRFETDIAPAVATPDGTGVLAVRFRPTAVVLVWPVADPERRTLLDVAAGERIGRALWRNSHEIVVLIDGDDPAAHRLEVWPLQGPRRVVLQGARDLSAIRPDGTAAIVDGQVVDLMTGATSPIPDLTGKRVDASIVLR